MRICCTSDLHGFLPDIPDCELLLLAGDYNPHTEGQKWWMRDTFLPWLEGIAARGIPVIGVAGNHDYIFEAKYRHLLCQLPWTYLEDSGTEFRGLKIWGSPWQPRFYDWAFNLDEPELRQKWSLIPEDTDILVLHGPPMGFGDTNDCHQRIGSPGLTARILEVQPKLVVCGHNHRGYGQYAYSGGIVVNCALMNDSYRPTNQPVVIDLKSPSPPA